MNTPFRSVLFWLLGACLALGLVQAAPAATPFLTVDGAVRAGTPTADGHLRKVFSEADILAMPTRAITTHTNWRPVAEFVGPTLKAVLTSAGADITDKTQIELIALNDYSVTIHANDLAKYDPILAHTVAGKRLSRREYGPLWLMYPRDDFEELRNNAAADGKLIWQIHRIVVH